MALFNNYVMPNKTDELCIIKNPNVWSELYCLVRLALLQACSTHFIAYIVTKIHVNE